MLTERFDLQTSDVDFLVTFQAGRENVFHDYFDLKFELERIVGRGVEVGAHLWDAAEATRLVHEFAHDKTETEFSSDPLIRSAIERQLEILGEALNRIRRDDADTAARC